MITWTNVKNKLPDGSCDTLQYLKQVDTASEVMLSDQERFLSVRKGLLDIRCTHWQPLPNPPNSIKILEIKRAKQSN